MSPLGCGGGLVVSMLAFYSDDPSSNPAEAYRFFCTMLSETNENKQKEAGVGPFKRTIVSIGVVFRLNVCAKKERVE